MLARSSSKVITVTPDLAADAVAATTAYADKDVIGDPIVVPNVFLDTKGTATLQHLFVRNKTTTKFAMDIWLLTEAPAGVTGANNSSFALTDSDLAKVVGVVSIDATTTYWNEACSNHIIASKPNIGMPLQGKAGSKDLYAIFVARGAVTFGAVLDLGVDLGFLQD
jgi:hypothetical protein